MAKTQIHTLIKQTMDRYQIQGKELASVVGIGQSHISDIRTGRKWASEEVFAAILEGMEQIAPGSKLYFCQMLAGENLTVQPKTIGDKIAELIEIADEDDVEKAMLAIGRKWKQEIQQRQSSKQKTGLSTYHEESIAV
ncbi:XRE family transcriptional regulator [Scytonema sp. UIC 10036]|uniref:XRE family transcriptional regulator n=1 Tax=Scytonema sp. UIC 10036 TaxID=2304196 RepID=UPI001A9BD7E2|nr:XRE family transcriptional regulator [Scytonema sp. UIC 10036]